MDNRERWLATLQFEKFDRIPLDPGNGRESTRKRWCSEGLPEKVNDIAEYAYRQVGGQNEWPRQGKGCVFVEKMIPHFEEKVIEQLSNSKIVQDWKGNICEIGNEYGVEYLRSGIDFVTRRWIKCPVENRADWENMKKRYDPDAPGRLPGDIPALSKQLENRVWPVTIHMSGPFWQLREWLGFEELCMLFHDDPNFVKDMIEFWENYIAVLLERVFEHFVPDRIFISEDMAYKEKSMVSPAMVQEFLLPTWRRWGEMVQRAGSPIYEIDSDGFTGQLIPYWIEAGFNVCSPMEVAAGNDLLALRKEYGKNMAFRGGVDKRLIAKGGTAIKNELKRLEPIVQDGGYIPGCDHGVPHDVSWPNYLRYVELLAKMTGWI